MREENVAVYDESIAKNIVRGGDFRDRDGDFIGTEKNWVDISRNLGTCLLEWADNPAKPLMKQARNAMYEYMVAAHCATEGSISENTITTNKYLKHLVDKMFPRV